MVPQPESHLLSASQPTGPTTLGEASHRMQQRPLAHSDPIWIAVDPSRYGLESPFGSASEGMESDCPELLDANDRSDPEGALEDQGIPLRPPGILSARCRSYSEEIDLMMADLKNGSPERQTVLDHVMESFWPMALNKRCCRLVQKAIEVGSPTYRQNLAMKMQGHVQQASRSPHANHVLATIIEVLPSEQYCFILDELEEEVLYVARHRFGCRILQRLLEECTHEQVESLASKVLTDVPALIRHPYGNFVIQHILQCGSSAQRHSLAEVIHEDILRLAKHRTASHVVTCALSCCAAEDVQRMVHTVLEDAGQVTELSRREYGSYVVRKAKKQHVRIEGV